MRYEELTIEGRNAVLEAFRAGKTIDRLFVLDGCQDGPVRTIVREAKSMTRLSPLRPRSVSTRCRRRATIRASSPMRRLMNTQR